MAQATNTLPQSKLDTFQAISASAVLILARLAAKNAVKEELRSQGVRVTLVPARDITTRAITPFSPATVEKNDKDHCQEAVSILSLIGLGDNARPSCEI